MAVLEVETRQAELLLDELKPPASELPKGEAWERYAGALAMVESLGLSWVRDERGKHSILPCTMAKQSYLSRQPALFRTRLKDVKGLARDVRFALAQREDTPAEVLDILANDPDGEVRCHAARNPHTPARVLATLVQEDDSRIKEALAENPSTPPETLAALVSLCEAGGAALGGGSVDWLLNNLLRNPGLSETLRASLLRTWHSINASHGDGTNDSATGIGFILCSEFIAGKADTPSSVLDELAASRWSRVRTAVAGNTSVPLQTLANLIDDPAGFVVWTAAHNPNVTPELLWAAMEGEARGIRDPGVLSTFGKSESDYVRYLVAGNRYTPADALDDLLDDDCEEVRREAWLSAGLWGAALKRHDVPQMSPDQDLTCYRNGPLWDRFSKQYGVERMLSSFTDAGIVNRLISCAGRSALEGIASSPYLPDGLRSVIIALDDKNALKGTAANPTTPPEHLAKLASNENPEVRAAVAGNPAAGEEVLRTLAEDDSELVRRAVARSMRASSATLRAMCSDPSADVRLAIVSNFGDDRWLPSLSRSEELLKSQLDSLERHWILECPTGNPSLDADVLQTLARDENAAVRATAAAKDVAPSSMLRRLAEDHSDMVRQAVASNQNTPPEVLSVLAHDGCPFVRSVALLNPSVTVVELKDVR